MRTVQDIIRNKPKPFNIINSSALVIDALQMLSAVNLSYLVVMDGDQYKGIFCERDYSRNVILKGRSSSNTKVDEAMTLGLPVVSMKDTVEHCMNMINNHKTRYLVALDGDDFVGIVTINDLLRQVISGKEEVFDQPHNTKPHEGDEKGKIY